MAKAQATTETKTTGTTATQLVKSSYGALEIHQVAPVANVNNFEDDERQATALNFPRITMPKGKIWEKFGDHEGANRTFTAIVVFHHETRAWWREKDSKGAPDCFSLDGKIGTTQGMCDSCAFKKDGCRGLRKLYLALLDGQDIPSGKLYTLLLPITGQVVFQKAMKALEKQGIGYRQIALTFRLKNAESQRGDPYVRLAFNLEDEDKLEVDKDYVVLDEETRGKVDLLYAALKQQWLVERQAIDEQARAARREQSILVAASPVNAVPTAATTIPQAQAQAKQLEAAPWEE